MTRIYTGDVKPTELAKEIACSALDGTCDLLLACRELASLRKQLSHVPADVLNTFIGVASETDELPIGSERKHWSIGALKLKDIEAAHYRGQVNDVVREALMRLLVALGATEKQH